MWEEANISWLEAISQQPRGGNEATTEFLS